MQQLSNQSKWKPWMAFVLEAVVLVYLIFAGSWMQSRWGMTGLALTELGFLVIAIVPVLVYKTPLKEVFPISKPRVRDVFGVIIFAYGGLLVSLIAIGLSLCIFPNGMAEVGALGDFLYGDTPAIVTFLVATVMPAVCEEAVHRGTILSHLRGLKKDWLVIIIVGLFFGLFHLSPLRFLSTAIMGGFLAYLMVKKNNFLLPMIFHFCNNLISVLSGIISSAASSSDYYATIDAAASSGEFNTLYMLGTYCLAGFSAPFVIVGADSLLFGKTHKKRWPLVIVLSVTIFITGIVVTCIGAAQMGMF